MDDKDEVIVEEEWEDFGISKFLLSVKWIVLVG